MSDRILGIDLGTTNSVVSILGENGETQVIEEDGRKTLPSVVGLDADGQLLVGTAAQNQWTMAPDRTIRSIKRKMGTADTVTLGDQDYRPQEVSAMILRTLRERAERQLGRDVRDAVITVPAFFTEQQREATREAGELAGLNVTRVINEPTAASLTYSAQSDAIERLLVYDLGGGTFDVSVVQIESGVIEVLASHGDTQLGGDDFDELLLELVCDRFQEQHDVDLRESLAARSRVLRAVEEAKCKLSSAPFDTIEEEFIAEQAGVALHLNMELSRLDYENLIEPLLNKTLVCVDEALSDAEMTAPQIDRVILVGGASRTPLVRQLLSDQLGRPIHDEVDPDLCVSMGAALQGGLIQGRDIGPVLVDITPHTLGVESLVTTPDGDWDPNYFVRLIHRNSPLPASRAEVVQTLHHNQEAVLVKVYQGENDDARRNHPVGELLLDELSEVAAGNEILIRFDLDVNGLLNVTAVEKRTGRERAVQLDHAIADLSDADRNESQTKIDAAFGSPSQVADEDPASEASTSQAHEPSGDTAGSPVTGSQVTGSQVTGSQVTGSQIVSELRALADEPLPPELKDAVTKAHDLVIRAEKAAGAASQQDAEEMADLIQALRKAIQARDLNQIGTVAAKLDDLVFYLQDA